MGASYVDEMYLSMVYKLKQTKNSALNGDLRSVVRVCPVMFNKYFENKTKKNKIRETDWLFKQAKKLKKKKVLYMTERQYE